MITYFLSGNIAVARIATVFIALKPVLQQIGAYLIGAARPWRARKPDVGWPAAFITASNAGLP